MRNLIKALAFGLAGAILIFFASRKLSAGRATALYNGTITLNLALLQEPWSIQKVKQVLSRRLDQKNITHSISIPGNEQLQVSISRISDTNKIIHTLRFNGKLEMLETYEPRDPVFAGFADQFDQLSDSLDPDATTQPLPAVKPEAMTSEVNELLDSMSFTTTGTERGGPFLRYFDQSVIVLPSIGSVKVSDTQQVMRILRDPGFRENLPADMIFLWGTGNTYKSNKKQPLLPLYALKEITEAGRSRISNEDIHDASASYGQEGRPIVSMNFTQIGSGKWEAMTRKNTGRYIAIVISDQVQSVPMVESAISGGNTQLAGNFTVEEADLLATLISSPYIPVNLTLQSASFRRVSVSKGLPELLWPLIGFLVLGLAAYFVLNALNINNKKTASAKK